MFKVVIKGRRFLVVSNLLWCLLARSCAQKARFCGGGKSHMFEFCDAKCVISFALSEVAALEPGRRAVYTIFS